ncbi:hypothetical protein [Streptomyces thermogriseus]|uniref:Uncharacterized protein n=1 Tax=Streptomyces thermogriseus TaxID=75292 RepID=A0ABN1T6J6_9ACTN
MKWYRAPEDLDPPTWTTLDNRVIDDDLSCRALGLLTRWLRRPPGVEIDSIPDMVKRAKREGRTNFEGRDALYAASYELERAGYLVRELVTVKGRHEWVVRIYSRPVPPERRSDPEDRKRASGGRKRAAAPAPKRRRAANPQVTPIPGKPDSEEPDSENPECSIKNSDNDSLSLPQTPSRIPDTSAEAVTDERENAAHRTDRGHGGPAGPTEQDQDPGPTAAADAGDAARAAKVAGPTGRRIPAAGAACGNGPSGVPQQRDASDVREDQDSGPADAVDAAAPVVDAWVSARTQAGHGVPLRGPDRIRRDAVRLLADGVSVEHLAAAAADMGRHANWFDLGRHLEQFVAPASKRPEPDGPRCPYHQSRALDECPCQRAGHDTAGQDQEAAATPPRDALAAIMAAVGAAQTRQPASARRRPRVPTRAERDAAARAEEEANRRRANELLDAAAGPLVAQ